MSSPQLPLPILKPAAAYCESTATEWGTSRYDTLRTCGQAYDLRYRQGIERKFKAAYFGVGSFVHASIAWMADGLRLGEDRAWGMPLDAWEAVQQWDEDPLKAVEQQAPLLEARRLLSAYWTHWGLEGASFPDVKILAAELPLDGVIAGARITTQADLVLLLPGRGPWQERIAFVDHKTAAAAPSEDAARRYSTRPQFLETSLLLQQRLSLGAPPPVIVNTIVKTKVPKFERHTVAPRESALRLLELELADLAQRHAAFKTPNLSACAPHLGALCWAFDWCHGSAETREIRFQIKSKE